MIHMQDVKATNMIAPQSIGTTAVTGYIDTKGWDFCTVYTNLGPVTTSTTITAMAFTEGATTSAADAITAGTGGTASGNFTIPVGQGTSSTGTLTRFDINLQGRKRYLKLSATLSHATPFAATAILSRGESAPDTATEAGVAAINTI